MNSIEGGSKMKLPDRPSGSTEGKAPPPTERPSPAGSPAAAPSSQLHRLLQSLPREVRLDLLEAEMKRRGLPVKPRPRAPIPERK
jgi:hypothetical protein